MVVRGGQTASNGRSYSPCFVFYSSVDACTSLEHSLPLVCVFSELVQRGHRCTFLVRSKDEATALIAVFDSVSPRGVWDRGSLCVMESMGESVVELTATSSVVGVVDFMARDFVEVLSRYGLAYYVTFPGTLKMLKKFAFGGGGFFGSRRPRSPFSEVSENSVACFVSSIEAVEVDAATCFFPETVPENVYFVRTFGSSPSIVGDQYLEKDENRAAVVVSCGYLSKKRREGLSALYQGLALCRDKLVVFWHGDPPPEEGEDSSASWLIRMKDARPRLSLLASAKVVALVTNCDWSDVTDAVCCGVPLLALPLTDDQLNNSRTAADLGVCEILDCRETERCFTPQRLASKILALSAAESKYQIHALSLQVNHFSNPEDYGSGLVANVVENDLEDGTLAKAQADTLRRIASLDDSVQTTTLSSKKSACAGADLDSGFYSVFCSSLDE